MIKYLKKFRDFIHNDVLEFPRFVIMIRYDVLPDIIVIITTVIIIDVKVYSAINFQ